MIPMLMAATAFTMSPCASLKSGRLLGILVDSNASILYEIDIDTGLAESITFVFQGGSDGGLAVAPDGTLYATFTGGDTQLAIIDPETGDSEIVGPTGFVDVCGLEFGFDGTLYGVDVITDQLLVLNTDTGEATVVGNLHVDIQVGGMAFISEKDTFLAGTTAGLTMPRLFTLNLLDGKATVIGEFGEQFDIVSSLVGIGPQLYASAVNTTLGYGWFVTVDSRTGAADIVGVFDPAFGTSMDGLAFLPGAGDVDRDGDVDIADYDIFVGCFTGPLDPGGEPLPVGCVFLDSDDDSDIDCLDWEAFIVHWTEDDEPPTFEECDLPPSGCEGDANGDNVVDPLDAGFVQARFGCPVNTGDPECDAADQTGDLAVDPLDLGFVLARFGKCQ